MKPGLLVSRAGQQAQVAPDHAEAQHVGDFVLDDAQQAAVAQHRGHVGRVELDVAHVGKVRTAAEGRGGRLPEDASRPVDRDAADGDFDVVDHAAAVGHVGQIADDDLLPTVDGLLDDRAAPTSSCR